MDTELEVKIKSTIRSLLKRNRLKYRDLSVFLGVNESSVKQLMARGKLPVGKLERISSFFGLSLTELLKLADEEKTEPVKLSLSQEQLLVAEPISILILFYFSAGFDFKQIVSRIDMNPKLISRALSALDKARLIERTVDQKIRILTRGPFKFNDSGPVNLNLRKKYLELLTSQIETSRQNEFYPRTFEMYLSKPNRDNFRDEYEKLVAKYSQLSRIDKARLPIHQREAVTGMFILARYDGWGALMRQMYKSKEA